MEDGVASSCPGAMPCGDPSIDSLPEEILARVLGLLQPRQLPWVECVNKRMRNSVVTHNLWEAQCTRECVNFEASVADIDSQSLRQVLLELQRPSHQQLTCNTSKSSTSKPFRVVTFPSCSSNSTINTTSPAPKPDSENTHSSPWARVVPFWGPGLAPRGSAETDTDCQPASYSVLIRLQQLCSGHRNLRATATEAEASSSSSSSNPGSSSSSGSQLWSFDVNVPDTVITSMFYKRLYWRLGAHSAKQSLIAEALQASSTDNNEQRIQNVLQPSARMRGFFNACYWSSGPSDDVDSTETLDFRLAHPLCVVRGVALQPFKAYFQSGYPVYPPKSVRFHFANRLEDLACTDQHCNGRSSTAVYPVQNNDSLQHFTLPPMLCVGGFVRVELIGRVQRQTLDNRYYTCICYVKVLGTPVYGFLPSESQHSPSTALQISSCDSRESCQTHDSSSQHDGCKQLEERQSPASSCVELKAVLQDPLLQAGGLRRVSEMGRLLLEGNLEPLPGIPGDPFADLEDELQGGSDDGDFAVEQVEENSSDDDNDDPLNLAHGVGLHMGAHLAHVPLHELLGGHIGGIDDHMEEYPLMHE